MTHVTRSSKRMLSALALAIVAALALTASAASAVTLHWNVGGTRLAQGTPTKVVGKSVERFTLGYSIAGQNLKVECSSMASGGTIENPSGGAAGTMASISSSLSGCAVAEPSGKLCVVEPTLPFESLKGAAAEQSSSAAIKYTPALGSYVISFSLKNCTVESMNHSYSFAGSVQSRARTSNQSVYAFDATSGSALTFGGQPAFVTGAYELTSESGAPVTLAAGQALTIGSAHWFLGGGGRGWEGAKAELAQGTPTAFSSLEGSTSFNVGATVAGVKVSIACSGATSTMNGSVENPSGGAAGTATGVLNLPSCSMTAGKATGCTVAPFKTQMLAGTMTEVAGAQAVKLAAAEGKETMGTFVISGCSTEALNGSKALTGAITATPDSHGSYSLQAAPVKFGGQTATVAGGFTLETS